MQSEEGLIVAERGALRDAGESIAGVVGELAMNDTEVGCEPRHSPVGLDGQPAVGREDVGESGVTGVNPNGIVENSHDNLWRSQEGADSKNALDNFGPERIESGGWRYAPKG